MHIISVKFFLNQIFRHYFNVTPLHMNFHFIMLINVLSFPCKLQQIGYGRFEPKILTLEELGNIIGY